MSFKRILAYVLGTVVLLFGLLLFYSARQPAVDRIMTMKVQGKTVHVVTIGSDGAINVKTSDSGNEFTTMGRRYVITRSDQGLLLDGKPLDISNGNEFSLLLYKDGRQEMKPGKY
jgi:hypothetical protein